MRDKKIGGVCAGLARYLGMDVTLMRVIVLAATIVTGVIPGTLAYLATWIIMPSDEEQDPAFRASAPASTPSSQPVE